MSSFLFKSRFVASLLGIVAGFYFGLIIRLMRWQRLEGAGLSSDDPPINTPVILVHWHSRAIGFPGKFGWRYRPHYLISSSRDGDIAVISGAINGNRYINGSTDKGGASALLGLRRLLKNNNMVALPLMALAGLPGKQRTPLLFWRLLVAHRLFPFLGHRHAATA